MPVEISLKTQRFVARGAPWLWLLVSAWSAGVARAEPDTLPGDPSDEAAAEAAPEEADVEAGANPERVKPPAAVSAQATPPAATLPAEPAEALAVPAAAPALFGSYPQLEASFVAMQKARASRDAPAEAHAFAELIQRKLAAGWPNLFAFSRALERDSEEALARGDAPEALRLAEYARDLAPSSFGARFLLVHTRLQATPKDVGRLLREAVQAIEVGLSDYLAVTLLVANGTTALGFAGLLTCALALVVLALRQVRYVVHDLALLLPGGGNRLHAPLFLLALLLVPVALRIGILPVFFVVLLIPFFHQEPAERRLASLCFVLLLAFPHAVPLVTRAWVATHGKRYDLYSVTRSQDAPKSRDRLLAEIARADAAEVRLALGLYAKRHADNETALVQFRRATELAPHRADAWVNLGTVEFLLGRMDAAQAAFEKAIEKNPNSIPALFNVARLHFRNVGYDKATQAVNRARVLDSERTNAYVAISRVIGPRYMVEETLSARDLWAASPYPHEQVLATEAAASIAPWLIGPFGAIELSLVGAVWLAVLWALSLAFRRTTLALPCPRCGRAICVRTDKDLPDRSLCGQCYHAFVAGDVETSIRITKERECRRFETRRSRASRLSSLVFAGTGHVLRGRAVAGILGMLLASLAWTALIFSAAALPWPVRVGATPLSIPGVVAAAVALAIVAAIAVLTVPERD